LVKPEPVDSITHVLVSLTAIRSVSPSSSTSPASVAFDPRKIVFDHWCGPAKALPDDVCTQELPLGGRGGQAVRARPLYWLTAPL
jgi:hypothetical protein